MSAIIDIKTDVLPNNYITELYHIYEAYAVKHDMTEFIDLGKIYVFFELMPPEAVKLNTIYEPTNRARDWYAVHRERLSLLPDGLKATKHIHTYPKEEIFEIPSNISSMNHFIEDIKKSKEFRSLLKDHMQFIKNKISMRLYHEYEVHIEGFKLQPSHKS
jgi:hypothetical protein